MKSLFFLIFCAILIIGCQNPPKAKYYACKEFSIDCELEKDFIVIQPIIFDEKTIDIYGNPIVGRSDCQWYMIPRKTKLMIPISFHVCTGGTWIKDVGYEYHYSECPTAEQINNCKDEWANMVRSDSTDLSGIIPGLKKVIIVVSGPNEFIVKKMWPTLAFAEKK